MKKVLLTLSLIFAPCLAGGDKSFQGLQEAVKERASELSTVLLDARKEHCRANALAQRVQEMAEGARLFLQELEHCRDIGGKGRDDKDYEKRIRQLSKNIIPAIMRLSRQVDQLERSIDKAMEKKDADRRELRQAMMEIEKKGIKSAGPKDAMHKKLVKLGKSLRKNLDASHAHYRELLDVQLELAGKRSAILALEGPYMKIRPKQPGSAADHPENGGPADLGDWISSVFGGQQAPASGQDSLRDEFEKAKKERETAERDLSSIKVGYSSKVSGLTGLEDLDGQIKSLGQSIQSLSASIDAQLEDLEKLTKNIAQETLSKVQL